MAVGDTHFESDGKALNVAITATVAKDRVIVAGGWVGIAANDGVSGDTIVLMSDKREYQLQVPSGLSVAAGDIIYITVATITGHYPDDGAYTTSSGAGKVAFMKATTAKDGNNIVTGILL